MAKRASLTSFSPVVADGAHIEAASVLTASTVAATETVSEKKKNPHVTVYLPADVIKTLKLLSIDGEGTVSDICSRAITDHLRQKGLIRGETFKV